jgi:ABC-type transporter Mla subunit MlaD
MAPQPIHYAEMIDQIKAQVDEFAGLKSRIVRGITPNAKLVAERAAMTEFLDDVHEDLSLILTRVTEAAAAYPEVDAPKAAKGSKTDDLVNDAVAKALAAAGIVPAPVAETPEEPGDDDEPSTEGEPGGVETEPTADVATSGRGRRGRQPVSA